MPFIHTCVYSVSSLTHLSLWREKKNHNLTIYIYLYRNCEKSIFAYNIWCICSCKMFFILTFRLFMMRWNVYKHTYINVLYATCMTARIFYIAFLWIFYMRDNLPDRIVYVHWKSRHNGKPNMVALMLYDDEMNVCVFAYNLVRIHHGIYKQTLKLTNQDTFIAPRVIVR